MTTNADSDRKAMTNTFLGEFEHMVLLAILQLRDEAFALGVIRELDQRVGRRVSRGALYKTLERLEDKGFVDWEIEETTPGRGGHPRRRFRVTSSGVTALRVAKDALSQLWEGLDGVLDGRAHD
jgi:DNA-binding PadR family transcriptional regulator